MTASTGSTEAPRPREAPTAASPDCLCMGLGPQLSALLWSLLPCGALANTLRATELDALRLLRAIIDQRIASLSGATAESAKGTRVVVE
jgi:hypothetical protein